MKWVKIMGVVFGAVVITTFGIDAADTLTGKSGTMLGQLITTENNVCENGMTEVVGGLTFTCIDIYEVSTSKNCPVIQPQSRADTQENMGVTSCAAESKKDTQPWRFITREQAQTACMRAGKRLPKSKEWYLASIGTLDSKDICNTSSGSVDDTGTNVSCVSASGVFDMIGNIWEWVSDDVIDGVYNGRTLPDEGYVLQVDTSGVATMTSTEASELFYNDYFWSSDEGAYGILKGGYYASKEDAGIYSFHGQTVPTTAGTAIGFRCVQ